MEWGPRSCLLACLASVLIGSTPLAATASNGSQQGSVSTRLYRQQVPLHSKGSEVHHKSVYYGKISVGSPMLDFEVVFDTGSGHVVVPSTFCSDPACRMHKRYKRRASRSGKDIDIDGSEVSGENRDMITVQFGTGEISAVAMEDVVCVGADLREEGVQKLEAWMLLQKGEKVLRSASSATLKEDETADKATTKPEAALPGNGCVEMRFLAATHMSEVPFADFSFDGVVGLGLPSLSSNEGFNFIESTASNGAWGRTGRERMFALFLAVHEKEDSEITFGGFNPERLLPPREGNEVGTDGLAWVDVHDVELGYWQIEIVGIVAGGQRLEYCTKEAPCRAIADTGTSLLAVPSELGMELMDHLEFTPGEASCKGPGPALELDLGKFKLVLDPRDIARPSVVNEVAPQGTETAASSEATAHVEEEEAGCVPMLMYLEVPEPLMEKTLLLGEPVLQRYYTVFDAASPPRVGIAEARHSTPWESIQLV